MPQSRKDIPIDIKREIVLSAGGRCQLCGKNLQINELTKLESKEYEFAHIYGYKPDSARYDKEKSSKLQTDKSNIILLCQSCHKFIDNKKRLNKLNKEYLPQHETGVLLAKKREQEEKVQKLLDALKYESCQIMKYVIRIANNFISNSTDQELKRTILYDNLYPEEHIIDLSNSGAFSDNEEKFWDIAVPQLEKNFETKLKDIIEKNNIPRIAVFAIAPMPLLIKLGTLLSDKISVNVYQKKKEPTDWIWEKEPTSYKYEIIEPTNTIRKKIAVNLSLSANINNERLHNILGQNVSIWTVKHENPHNDYLRSKTQLEELRKTFRDLYDKIIEKHGNKCELHIFPAMPVSAAVEFGRVRNSKCNNPLVLYDENKDNSFKYALKID